jgi:hypothetical protein
VGRWEKGSVFISAWGRDNYAQIFCEVARGGDFTIHTWSVPGRTYRRLT